MSLCVRVVVVCVSVRVNFAVCSTTAAVATSAIAAAEASFCSNVWTCGDRYVASAAHTITHTHTRTNGLPPLSNKSKTKQNMAIAFAVAAKHISTSAFAHLLGARLPFTHTHIHTNVHTQRLTNKAQLMLWLNGQRRFKCWFEHVSFVVVVVPVVAVVVLVLLLLTILLSRLYYSSFLGVLFSYSYEFQRCAL